METEGINMIEVLNLGAGVQSSAVLLMSIEGVLPKLDHAIFSDTGWEPAAVYRQLDWLTAKAESAGIEVHRVQFSNIRDDDMQGDMRAKNWLAIPYFTRCSATGKKGQIRRQCTSNYKIRVIEHFMRRDLMGLRPRQRAPKTPQINQWFGISFDERTRMRVPTADWSSHFYPLVEMKWDRVTCHNWMADKGYPDAPRSACIGCPYHSNREWREMREQRPDEWKDAVEFDEAMRLKGGEGGELFLHSSCLPLGEANLFTDESPGQLRLWDDECSGMCGL